MPRYDHDPDLMTPEEWAEYRRTHPIPPGTLDLRNPTPEVVEEYFRRHPNVAREIPFRTAPDPVSETPVSETPASETPTP